MLLELEHQNGRGGIIIEGHDWHPIIERFLADIDSPWTPVSFWARKDYRAWKDRPKTAPSQPQLKACSDDYSASFSQLEKGSVPDRKPPCIPLKPLSTTTVSDCPSLVGGENVSLSAKANAGSCFAPAPQPLQSALNNAPSEANQPEPRIFQSIREVLDDSPAYAERMVRAIQALPHAKQSILLVTPHDSNAAPSLVDDGGDGTAPPPGSGSTSGGSSSSYNKAVKRKSRDRKHHDPNDEKSSDGSGQGPGSAGGAGHTGKKQKRSGRHYARPYSVAFPISFAKNRVFQSCRPPGYMRKRSDFTKHLAEVHSPTAQSDDPKRIDNAQYYMTTKQWDCVNKALETARMRHCDGDTAEWFKKELDVYLAIWDNIFPKSKFPSLARPISPFHLDEAKQPCLQQQGRVMLEAMYSVRAQIAVESGRITAENEYQPSHDEYMEMMSQAFAIVTNTNPVVSMRVISMPADELQDTARDVASTFGIAEAPDCIAGDSHQTGTTPSSDTTMMGTPASSSVAVAETIPAEPGPAAPSKQGSTMEVPLGCPLTDIQLVVADNTHHTDEKPRLVTVTVPPGAVLQTFNRKPVDERPATKQPVYQDTINQQPLNQWPIDPQSANQINQAWLNTLPLQANTFAAGTCIMQNMDSHTVQALQLQLPQQATGDSTTT